jgi:hypothetical protein
VIDTQLGICIDMLAKDGRKGLSFIKIRNLFGEVA